MTGQLPIRGRHLPLLLSLVTLFLLHPLLIELDRAPLFRFGLAVVLVLAAYTIGSSRWRLWVVILLGLPAALGQIAAYAQPQGSAPLVAATLGLAFLLFVSVLVLRSVLDSGPVTGDKIAGATSVFLLLGLVWALLFGILAILDPLSFRAPNGMLIEPGAGGEHAFLYFSFVTLTTLGFGDISPATHWSQTFVWMEAVAGQLFLAILIARLVGLHIAHSTKK